MSKPELYIIHGWTYTVEPWKRTLELLKEAGIKVSPLPGANAALSALICSGLDTTAFTFYGFLPKTGKKRMVTFLTCGA